jgi:gamma-glutamyl-gamma-aminobutyrate hydrolase PuuD
MKPKQPLVGITGNYGDKGCELAEGYYLSVLQAGGTPVAIPPYSNKEALLTLLDKLDAIIFSGGGDINPLLLGEEPLPQLRSVCPQRDEAELLLAREAYRRQIPMLGICRGIQIMAAALGGKNYQDIYVQGKGATIKHSQDMPRHSASHTVNITEGSLLQHIFGSKQTLAVNSFHHQAVKDLGAGLVITARASDGIVEGFEKPDHPYLVAAQWHPERLVEGPHHPEHKPLFQSFVDACRK